MVVPETVIFAIDLEESAQPGGSQAVQLLSAAELIPNPVSGV